MLSQFRAARLAEGRGVGEVGYRIPMEGIQLEVRKRGAQQGDGERSNTTTPHHDSECQPAYAITYLLFNGTLDSSADTVVRFVAITYMMSLSSPSLASVKGCQERLIVRGICKCECDGRAGLFAFDVSNLRRGRECIYLPATSPTAVRSLPNILSSPTCSSVLVGEHDVEQGRRHAREGRR